MNKRLFTIIFITLLLLSFPAAALAQHYSFSIDEMIVHTYWHEDGTLSLDYTITFTNHPNGDPIDVVDIGLPNKNYDLSTARAEINGVPLSRIEDSPYVTGIAVELGNQAIQPGKSGTLHFSISGIRDVLYVDDQDPQYASAVFKTTWFDSSFVSGTAKITVTYHLPPSIQPEEPRWHSAPSGFSAEPTANIDNLGRITYTWENPAANPSEGYLFGASFPARNIPPTAIQKTAIPNETFDQLVNCLCNPFGFCIIVIFFVALSIVPQVIIARRRSMKYLPPSISIEGHGIKRGLTAVEAAVLMEQPMEKILTMILFSVLKKNAAEITSREPLEIKVADPLPEDLYPYEKEFLKIYSEIKDKRQQQIALRDLMVNLVKSLAEKMKGFSRKETVDYYKSILEKAWQQVQSAQTPEVKSELYNQNLDWTILDPNFERRTSEVFRTEPIFVPNWWWRYDPTFARASTMHRASPTSTAAPSVPQGSISLPTLPGSTFAANVVGGMQNIAGNLVGNITSFTSSITNATNPQPKTSSSSWKKSSGGGCACACACACAGCACACAGGGR